MSEFNAFEQNYKERQEAWKKAAQDDLAASIKALDLEQLQKAHIDTHQVTAKVEDFIVPEVKVSLEAFRVIEAGKDLEVRHPAFSDEFVGIISKAEYATADREALLKEMVQDKVAGSKIILAYEDDFIDPSIELTRSPEMLSDGVCECVDADCPVHIDNVCNKEATTTLKRVDMGESMPMQFCAECAADAMGSGLFTTAQVKTDLDITQAKVADVYRQTTEREASQLEAQKGKVIQATLPILINKLQEYGYAGIKILTAAADKLTIDAEQFRPQGTILVTAEVHTKTGIKHIACQIKVADSITMPTHVEVEQALTDTPVLSADILQEIERGVIEQHAKVDEEMSWQKSNIESILQEGLAKTAAESNATQFVGPTTVMHLNKHLLGLPEDTEIGDVVFADGAHWKLVCKGKNQLSKGEDDGSIWTFEKVPAEDTHPEHKIAD